METESTAEKMTYRHMMQDSKARFEPFWREIVQEIPGAPAAISKRLNMSKIRKQLENGDYHLNGVERDGYRGSSELPIHLCDAIAKTYESRLREILKDRGALYSPSCGVCFVKQAVRMAAELEESDV